MSENPVNPYINFKDNETPLNSQNLNQMQKDIRNEIYQKNQENTGAITKIKETIEYDLSSHITSYVKSITRLYCKKKNGVVHISCYLILNAISANTNVAIFENLPNDILNNDIIDFVAMFSNTVIGRGIIDKGKLNVRAGSAISSGGYVTFNFCYVVD